MGQLDVLKYLQFKGADIFRLDDKQESAVHCAARQGHKVIIEYLSGHGLSLNARNMMGETPLHLAAKQGEMEAVEFLSQHCEDINAANEGGETALHLASMRGHSDVARCLMTSGADADVTDKHGCTPLHWALRRHHISVAVILLKHGCNIDILDTLEEAPIHIVAREGLLSMAQTLCAFGCKVEVPNKSGQYPLHLAARGGQIEVVRCLCLAGCDVELKNKDGIKAEIVSLAQGFNEMTDLLSKLRNAHFREECISQLIPSTRPISKVKLKLFGHSGVGKSAFVENIKCGYFTSWFKRSLGSMSPLASLNKAKDPRYKSSIELNSHESDYKKLNFETCLDTYTQGVDVQQLNVSGIGDISVWEFSGHEPYFALYDYFIGNTNCLHLVFFSLNDPCEVQEQQVLFWLVFLESRISVQEPLGYRGKGGNAGRVALVATHADISSCHRVAATGEYVSNEAISILNTMQQRFGAIFDLCETVFVIDTHVAGSPAMKALKTYIVTSMENMTQGLPKSTGFLEAVHKELTTSWRKSRSCFPVMAWKPFVDLVHCEVNPLAGEEHMKEIIQQLQIMGEISYLTCDTSDTVILDPSWLCGTILGHLLSQEHLDRARVTGIYSSDDIQLLFPEVDGQIFLKILEALQLCTGCETEGEVEYEFPCFNLVETLDGLWNPSDGRANDVYGGVRLTSPQKHILHSLFPRLQVNLRRFFKENADPDTDLYQWYHGSKYSSGLLEAMVTLEGDGEAYEIKTRGPSDMKSECFFFQEDIISVITQMFTDICPGVALERHYLSCTQLQSHARKIYAYHPAFILQSLLREGIHCSLINEFTDTSETLRNIMFFGASEVIFHGQSTNPSCLYKHNQQSVANKRKLSHSNTAPSFVVEANTKNLPRRKSLPRNQTFCSTHKSADPDYCSKLHQRADSSPALLQDFSPAVIIVFDLHASQLSLLSCQCLCNILDPSDSMGRDWCMLGVLLGMMDKLPKLDPGDNPAFSPTACILSEWMKRSEATIGQLLIKLLELERTDAIQKLLPTLPFFKIAPCYSKYSMNGIVTHYIPE